MIAIPDQISRRTVPWKRLSERLSGPRRRRIGGHSEMHDASAIVRQKHENEQEAVRDGRHHEEIGLSETASAVR